MSLVRFSLCLTAGAVLATAGLATAGLGAGCASGTAGEDTSDFTETDGATVTTSAAGGAGPGASTTAASTATTGGGGGGDAGASSSSSAGAGGDPGPTCTPPQHLCDGMCVGNTVASGCTNSVTCDPCPEPSSNGAATCTPNGDCSVACDAGYTAVGGQCQCATECCSEADCSGNEVCTAQGQCTSDCGLLSNPAGFLACNLFCQVINSSCASNGTCGCQ